MNRILSTDPDVVGLLTKINTYDYIIVGSGFGGGLLADVLASRNKRVLIIERGDLLFSTHVLNTSRPFYGRGSSNSAEGNESIYDDVKAKVRCTEGSDPYIGGPVYCVGGRSNLWGIWTPEISKKTLERYFPPEIVTYLLGRRGYGRAFNMMTANSQEHATYPEGSNQISSADIRDMAILLQRAVPGSSGFNLMPVAAQFNSSAPYRFPQGAYSTTLALVNRMYANNKYLTVLLNTEVLAVQHAEHGDSRKVLGITVRDTKHGTIRNFEIGNAKVILSAGTIGTATIALNSGLQQFNGRVGQGIIDHDVCYSRFAKRIPLGGGEKPLNMKTFMQVGGQDCLVTVTVNANFFLAGSSTSLPNTHYYGEDGNIIDPRYGLENENLFDTICVLFEFVGHLDNENAVLGLPGADPVLRIKRPQQSTGVQAYMDEIIKGIRNAFLWGNRLDVPNDLLEMEAPKVTRLGFGVFSHECGTMRMDSPGHNDGVVDSDQKVKNFDNLWVSDLSVFPVSPEANPSLTLAALALRLADHLQPEITQPENPPILLPLPNPQPPRDD
ncbi:hypothetical protein QBC43DRAFT_212110 [Cladorrhinum sp. PSN259]|nr:hypothetical protein QBC43DRAFT_212110 [Cladorrhinum sp. PSN259]